MIRDYFRRKLKAPVLVLLRKGMTPERIAFSLACGIVLGLFPIMGATTLLCLAAALVFRLNTTAAILANWAVYPLQIILIAPFFAAGARLFGTLSLLHASPRSAPLAASSLMRGADLVAASSLHAILVWGLAAPLAMAVLYLSLLPVIRRLSKAREAS
jgi:uncharacterized protein (DUF2062 family)